MNLLLRKNLSKRISNFLIYLKGLGLAGVFVLPGGLLAIAFIVKAGKKLGIDIIPDKYRK
jgi:hypothetical protein